MKSLKIFAMTALAFAAIACNEFYEGHYKDISELLIPENELVIPAEGAEDATAAVYAMGEVSMEYIDGEVEWATVTRTAEKDDFKVVVNAEPNEGLRRMFRIRFTHQTLGISDTLYVKQEGVAVPYLKSDAPYFSVGGKLPEMAQFQVQTNIPEKLKKEILYVSGGEDWLEIDEVAETFVKVVSKKNETDKVRKAQVRLWYVDGWNDMHELVLHLTQADRNGLFGKTLSFAEVRALASGEQTQITEDFIIDGVVVSDCDSRNMALNPATNYNKVDSTYALRTAYVQSADGGYGLRLFFDKASDNNLKFGSTLKLSLSGTTLVKEMNPERYTLTGIFSGNIVTVERGAEVAVKQKNIASLTPEDVYTYVTLTNTEFAHKDYSYANVHENYALKSELNADDYCADRFDGWSSVLTDKDGNSILAPVNSLCLWRRSGRGVPKGVGNSTGIIVSEDMPRWGNAGPYQIRVIDEAGFAQSWSEGSSFADLAVIKRKHADYSFNKYVEWYPDGPYLHDGSLNIIVPSVDIEKTKLPVAHLYCENKVEPVSGDKGIRWREAYNGLTVARDGKATMTNSKGEAQEYVALNIIAATAGWYDFDETDAVTEIKGIRTDFSTAGISGSTGILMTFDMGVGAANFATSKAFPAHWMVEYALNDGEYKPLKETYTGADYFHLRSIPFSDTYSNGHQYRTSSQCGMGFTQHAYLIPADAFGQEKVSVRIRPYDDVITITPMLWSDDSEVEKVSPSVLVQNYIRFGEINFRYR